MNINHRTIITISAVIVCTMTVFPQEPSVFEKKIFEVGSTIAAKDIDLAIRIADSLQNAAKTDLETIEARLFLAHLYGEKGETEKSIQIGKEAEQLAERSGLYAEQAKALGGLASKYREMGLTGEGRRYLDKGIIISSKIKEPNKKNLFQAMAYLEKAGYDQKEEKYIESLNALKTADFFIDQYNTTQAARDYLRSTKDQFAGTAYLQLQQNDSALYYFNRSLDYLEQNQQRTSRQGGAVLAQIGKIYLDLGERNKACVYLSEALLIAESAQHPELSQMVYQFLKEYYKNIGEDEKYIHYTEKYDSVMLYNTLENEKTANSTLTETSDNFRETLKDSRYAKWAGYFLSMMLLVASGYIFYIKNKQKKDYERFTKLISEKNPSDNTKKLTTINTDKTYVPEETEIRILTKLEKFESSKLFTQNSISLSSLATYCETNTKYLSHIINTYKKQDFNNYINELRIKYIINKLNKHSLHRKYKIATLAEEAGFSSQNKFATVFKKVTSISPSVFIKYLEEEERN